MPSAYCSECCKEVASTSFEYKHKGEVICAKCNNKLSGLNKYAEQFEKANNIKVVSDENHIGLIQQLPCSRIRQIRTTKEQQLLWQMLLGSMSQDKPIVVLPK